MSKIETLFSGKEDLLIELDLLKEVLSRPVTGMGDLVSSFKEGAGERSVPVSCNDVHMLSSQASANTIEYTDRPQLRGNEELVDLLSGSSQVRPSTDFPFSVSSVLHEFFLYENNVTCEDRGMLLCRYDVETGELLNRSDVVGGMDENNEVKGTGGVIDGDTSSIPFLESNGVEGYRGDTDLSSIIAPDLCIYDADFWSTADSDEVVLAILGNSNDTGSEVEATEGDDAYGCDEEVDTFWDTADSDEVILAILGNSDTESIGSADGGMEADEVDATEDVEDGDEWDDIFEGDTSGDEDNIAIIDSCGEEDTGFEDEDYEDDGFWEDDEFADVSCISGVDGETDRETDIDPYDNGFWDDDVDDEVLLAILGKRSGTDVSPNSEDRGTEDGEVDEVYGVVEDSDFDGDDDFDEDFDFDEGDGIDGSAEFNKGGGHDEDDDVEYDLEFEDEYDNNDADVNDSNSLVEDSSTEAIRAHDKSGDDKGDDLVTEVADVVSSEGAVGVHSSNPDHGWEDGLECIDLGFSSETGEDSSGIIDSDGVVFNSISDSKKNNSSIDTVENKLSMDCDKSQSHREAKEALDSSVQEPTDLRQFLRKHPKCDYDFARKYFTKKQLDDAIKIGRVIKKGNTLRLM